MIDIRFVRKDGQSVVIAIVRKRFFESALQAGASPERACAIWNGAMFGQSYAREVIEEVREIDRQQQRWFRIPVMRLLKSSALIVAAMTFSFSSWAYATGVDSRAYSCEGLHALVAANRFVFINYPSFMDFVVTNASSCAGGEVIQVRSVTTIDNPECFVNRCRNLSGSN